MKIFRYEVPVDDQWHKIELSKYCGPLHVASRDAEAAVVEFWALHVEGGDTITREFIVIGTGHEVPNDDVPDGLGVAGYRGTALAKFGLVWHLFERPVQ